MLKDLIVRNRSTRKYYQDVAVSRETLLELVELARLSPSGGNRQLLKYYISCEPEKNAVIYDQIGLGGNPPEGERPSAYIIILNDTKLGTYGAHGSGPWHRRAKHSLRSNRTRTGRVHGGYGQPERITNSAEHSRTLRNFTGANNWYAKRKICFRTLRIK